MSSIHRKIMPRWSETEPRWYTNFFELMDTGTSTCYARRQSCSASRQRPPGDCAVLSGTDFAQHGLAVGNAPRHALPGQDADLDFCDVQPAAVLAGVVDTIATILLAASSRTSATTQRQLPGRHREFARQPPDSTPSARVRRSNVNCRLSQSGSVSMRVICCRRIRMLLRDGWVHVATKGSHW